VVRTRTLDACAREVNRSISRALGLHEAPVLRRIVYTDTQRYKAGHRLAPSG
jgi:hypothetical protein